MFHSTGICHPTPRRRPSVTLVPAASMTIPAGLPVGDTTVDLLVVGSQKALMLPPGLSFTSVSPKAWKAIDACPTCCFYFDMKLARKKMADFDTPFTPAHTMILALGVNILAGLLAQ